MGHGWTRIHTDRKRRGDGSRNWGSFGTGADFCRAGSGAESGPYGVVRSGTGGSFSGRNGLGELRTAAGAAVPRAASGAVAVGDAVSKSRGAGAAGCGAIGAGGQMHAGGGCDWTG